MALDLILIDASDNQGELFEYSAFLGYNSEEFIEKYMHGDVARRMYLPYSSIQMADRAYVLEEFLDQAPIPRDGKIWNPEAMWWTGYLYRYWGSYKRIGPSEIYAIADGATMVSLYPGYHTLDDEQAIDRLYERHKAILRRKAAL